MGIFLFVFALCGCVTAGNVTNGNLDAVLDIYNPYRLAESWTLKENQVSPECWASMEIFVQGLLEDDIWAVKMADASGRDPSAFLWGNDHWTGSSMLCFSANGNSTELGTSPFQLSFFSVTFGLDFTLGNYSDSRTIDMGLCLPDTCSNTDVERILMESAYSSRVKLPRTVRVLQVRNLNEKYSLWDDQFFIITVAVVVITTELIVAGTITDIVKIFVCKLCKTREGAIKNGILASLVVPFSVRRSTKWIFTQEAGSDGIKCIHGIRVLSMLWVIMFHSLIIPPYYSDNRMLIKEKNVGILFLLAVNAVFAVDNFFLMSGIVTTLSYLKRKEAESETESSIRRCGVNLRDYFTLIFKRYCRLSPPYFFVLLLTAVTGKWYHTRSIYTSYQPDHENCQQFMWRNLLYINNLYSEKEMCMMWSWYLANEFQFYIVGLVIIILSVRHFKTSLTFLVLTLIGSWMSTAVIAYSENSEAKHEDLAFHLDSIYFKPWSRIPPYLIGICTGWLIFKRKEKTEISKIVLLAGWLLGGFFSLGVLTIPYNVTFSRWTAAIFIALYKSVWSLSLAWLIFVCASGYGGLLNKMLGWRGFLPLSRLSYIAYLVHVLIIRNTMLANDGPLHVYTDLIVILYFGYAVVSYLTAYVICLGFEAPYLSLLKLAFGKKIKK